MYLQENDYTNFYKFKSKHMLRNFNFSRRTITQIIAKIIEIN